MKRNFYPLCIKCVRCTQTFAHCQDAMMCSALGGLACNSDSTEAFLGDCLLHCIFNSNMQSMFWNIYSIKTGIKLHHHVLDELRTSIDKKLSQFPALKLHTKQLPHNSPSVVILSYHTTLGSI